MILALMSDPEFRNTRLKKDFRLIDLAEKLDEDHGKIFGQITKETFLKLEPAFNQEVLQVSVAAWVEEVEKVLALRDADVDAHAVGWKSSFSKLQPEQNCSHPVQCSSESVRGCGINFWEKTGRRSSQTSTLEKEEILETWATM